MSVWLCVPSARPVEQVKPWAAAWRERGYNVALWRDDYDIPCDTADFVLAGKYPGYALAVNAVASILLWEEPYCDWIVTGGDDVWPDLNHTAQEIANQCFEHFVQTPAPLMEKTGIAPELYDGGTFGIMQPTGDRWGDTPRSRAMFGEHRGAYVDRVCGSPWMGREWCLRANHGKGPLYPGFQHMFVDECLQHTAQHLGVLWQRSDLIHLHKHALRESAHIKDLPQHAARWNTAEHWRESKALYDRLKADNWKECLPL